MTRCRLPGRSLCLAVALVFAGTQLAEALTLETAVELAFAQDAGLEARMLETEAAGFDGWQAVGGYGPELAISGGQRWLDRELLPELQNDRTERRDASVESFLEAELRQPVVNFERAAGVFRGAAEIELADVRRQLAREDLLIRVKERFYRILSSQEGVRLAAAERNNLEKQANSAADRLRLGAGTILDQHRAEVRYRAAQAAEVAAETELEQELEALEELIDRTIEQQLVDPFPERDLPDLPRALDDWLQIALQKNTRLRQKELETTIAQLVFRQVQGRFLPHLELYGAARWFDGDQTSASGERTETEIGFRLELDLLAGGRDAAALLAASRRRAAARQREIAARRELKRSVSSLYQAVRGTRELVFRQYQASESGRLALEASRLSYEQGSTVLLDLLDAQREYYRAARQYHASRYDYLIYLERFRLAVGGGDLWSRVALPGTRAKDVTDNRGRNRRCSTTPG